MSEQNYDKLPTLEELMAEQGSTTEKLKRAPIPIPQGGNPSRMIAIDPLTNAEIPLSAPNADNGEQEELEEQDRQPRKRDEEGDFEIPDKLRGKDEKEIARSYVELERKYGSMANELGHLRNIVEQVAFGKRQRDLGLEEEEDSITSDDLLRNPAEAVEKLARKSTKTLEEKIAALEAQRLEEEFRRKHGNYEETVNDPEFLGWINKSPYRQRLAQRAAETGDYEAADELLSTWEEIQSMTKAEREEEEQKDKARRDDLIRQGRLERGGAAGSVTSKRIYKEADIHDLRLRNPDLYYSPQMQQEIMAAYRENRVRKG